MFKSQLLSERATSGWIPENDSSKIHCRL